MTPSLLHSDTQLNQSSYYEASVQRDPALEPLTGSVVADVVVVGAGFAGLSAALELQKAGMSVVVLEADRICSGASGRNGGQTIVGYASGMQPFEQQLGAAMAKQAWRMSIEAIELIDQRIAQYNISCDRVHGYLYVADHPRKAIALEQELEAMEKDYGFGVQLVKGADVKRHIQSDRYVASAYETVSGHLHPLKYGLGLAKAAIAQGVTVYENTPALRLQEESGHSVVLTPQGSVTAQFVLLAGNCTLNEYGPELAPAIKPRIMPVGTYMIATEPLDSQLCRQLIANNAAVCDNNFVLDYFRISADHRMLFGGRVSYSTRTPPDLKEAMRQRMVAIFPALESVKVDFVWGGFVDISMNRAPDFGRIGARTYYLQGFSGHGVALSGLAGQVVAQAIMGQADRFDVFARLKNRPFPGGALLRTPALILATAYHRLKDYLP